MNRENFIEWASQLTLETEKNIIYDFISDDEFDRCLEEAYDEYCNIIDDKNG